MGKFNTAGVRTATASAIRSEATATATTHEGAPGYVRDLQSELFLLAVTNMVGEDTYYERGGQRDDRFTDLVHQVAVADVGWLTRFGRWLRVEANMRSASLVLGAEGVRARLAAGAEGGNRQLIDAVLQRADEPGELVAYWTGRYGRALPKPVKRGVADAALRLYAEYPLLKYDTSSHGVRFADVLALTHPGDRKGSSQGNRFRGPWQYDLFGYTINRRYGREDQLPETLRMIAANKALRDLAGVEPWALLDSDRLKAAGMTWEDVLSLAGSKVDKAQLWTALVPLLGYMAGLRNLRNIDEAGVPDHVAAQLAARLADPEQVAASRQLPMRFLSAYRAAPNLRWAHPLDQALTVSIANIPVLTGRTLVMVDTSSSMEAGFSKDGTLMRWDAAALFGIALGQRAAAADVVSFSSTARYQGDPHGAHTKVFPLTRGESLLRSLDRWTNGAYFLGGGTATAAAIRHHYARHDRVVIITDEQAAHDGREVTDAIPAAVPMYTWNLAGYQHGHAPSGSHNRHTFGGLTDQAFRMIPLLEAGRDATWPF